MLRRHPKDGSSGWAQAEQRQFDAVARDTAARVIRTYSSSFGLASRLLGEPVRGRIRDVYAFVRLADEIVDGPIGVSRPDRAEAALDRFEDETRQALVDGYSPNLVVHAFAGTARRCGIDDELIAPFLRSMRADLTVTEHDEQSFLDYVYGSAEVVGLMCLRVFMIDGAPAPVVVTPSAELEEGARRLGAAFQKVNFLRDLGEDFHVRGRRYFPGIDPDALTEADKHRILDDIDSDLATSKASVDALPKSSRVAVAAAHSLFDELSARLRATPASLIPQQRVRVPSSVKNRIAMTSLVRGLTP
ncbi:phytoene/squalene synthase family protein [Knoellia flava]|uniref:Phytoene synthase n=2 Tax=Knoellia flava TaxID=913969 RepID=A0A8H9FR73_9MICO|nr:phytoene/squalene synthase family protein [Knoellia flava]GGB74427.1 phytoene synthase [Knoellia flava]